MKSIVCMGSEEPAEVQSEELITCKVEGRRSFGHRIPGPKAALTFKRSEEKWDPGLQWEIPLT